MKRKHFRTFQRQSQRVRFRLNRTAVALSLIIVFGGGALFFYLNTGNVQTSKAAEADVVIVSDPQAETGLEVSGLQRISASDRYASRSSQNNDNSVFVRSLK